jgi:AraC family transcriptional regulator of adaptative response/methylated-DNA-[protein]-cysteine methyltransferase
MKVPTGAEAHRAAVTENDPRWAAVAARDESADGTFFFSVESTGVYCRPGCPARTPRPENVRFHATAAEAEAAGFRPCRRCKPNQPTRGEQYAEKMAAACRRIADSSEEMSLNALAHAAGMSPSHFHRTFKAHTGLTPKAYTAAHRANRVREELVRSETVTDAVYEAGYQSSGRFYAHTKETLGMTPVTYRKGGPNETIRFAIGQSSMGAVLVAMSEKGVCAITMGEDPDALAKDLQDRFPRAEIIGADHSFEDVVARVLALVETPSAGLDLPLDVRGTAFQQRVWQALRGIPRGATATYSEIAERIGSPPSVRAVAQACASNRIAVAIPCHRVVRADGGLSGYRWGVARKRELLDREAGT